MTADGLIHFEHEERQTGGRTSLYRIAVPISQIAFILAKKDGNAEVKLVSGGDINTGDSYENVIALYQRAVAPDDSEDDEVDFADDDVIDTIADAEDWKAERDRLLQGVPMTGENPYKSTSGVYGKAGPELIDELCENLAQALANFKAVCEAKAAEPPVVREVFVAVARPVIVQPPPR